MVYLPAAKHSSSAMLNTILHFNAQGVALLKKGRYNKAITAFSSSLTTLRRSIGGNIGDIKTQDEYALPLPELRMYFDDFTTIFSSSDTTLSDTGDEPFLFRYSIKVILPRGNLAEANGRVSRTRLTRLSFALLFNLALAFHCSGAAMRGNEGELATQQRLDRAVRLYQVAHSVLAESAAMMRLGSIADLAIKSNLGHIYETLGDYARAKDYYNQVISGILADSQFSRFQTSGMVPFENRLLSNAMRHQTKGAAAA